MVALTGSRLNQLAEEIQGFADLFEKMDELKKESDDAVRTLPERVTSIATFETDKQSVDNSNLRYESIRDDPWDGPTIEY